jgi:hypothetical protein
MRNRAPCAACLCLLATLAASRAEEAICRDGVRVPGALRFDAKDRLQFIRSDSSLPVAPGSIHTIGFPPAEIPVSRLGLPLCVHLDHGQRLTGELIRLDAGSVSLRTSWPNPAPLPRRAVVAATHAGGKLVRFYEDFEGVPALQFAGSPGFAERRSTSGKRSLFLQTPGQSATLGLDEPLASGSVGVNFLVEPESAGARWLVELKFAGKTAPQQVEAVLVGEKDGYAVRADGIAGESRSVTRTSGWHRLHVRFHPEFVLVDVDGQLLFASGKKGPGGPLQEIRLACIESRGIEKPHGGVYYDDLAVAEPMPELTHDCGDLTQDEIWLRKGDQLFAEISQADSHQIQWQNQGKPRKLDWTQVRGIFFRLQPGQPVATEGMHVRVWVRSGFSEPDVLEGVLRSLDERRLLMRHAVLGDLEIDRSRLHRLQPIFDGRRIELEARRHHVGEKGRIVTSLSPPRAEGPVLSRTFRLDAVPTTARLKLNLRSEPAGSRTQVFVNGQLLKLVERPAGQTAAERLLVLLPASVLQRGENTVELRQAARDKETKRSSCVVSEMLIEVPR